MAYDYSKLFIQLVSSSQTIYVNRPKFWKYKKNDFLNYITVYNFPTNS